MPECRAAQFAFPSRKSPTPLDLFLYYDHDIRRYCVPTDLRERLEHFVPEPEAVRLDAVAALPASIDDHPLIVRPTELDAITDLAVMLRLADQGRIQVSDKTAQPSGATLRLLSERLTGGEFFGASGENVRSQQHIDPIKSFAWPLLLQSAGLVRRQSGGKLSLSPTGLKALSAAPADTLRTVSTQDIAAHDLELLSEFVLHFALPLKRQVGGRHDQDTAHETADLQLLDQQPRRDGLAGAGKKGPVTTVPGLNFERSTGLPALCLWNVVTLACG